MTPFTLAPRSSWLSLIAAALVALSLSACGGAESPIESVEETGSGYDNSASEAESSEGSSAEQSGMDNAETEASDDSDGASNDGEADEASNADAEASPDGDGDDKDGDVDGDEADTNDAGAADAEGDGSAAGEAGGDEEAGVAGGIAVLAAEDMAPAAPLERADYYSAPAEMGIDGEEYAYFATITTSKGDITIELFPEVAPQHVNSFLFLSQAGFFDGLVFHRVVPGFVIQGGDPTGTGGGGPGYAVKGEFMPDNPVPHRIGTLAMARTPDPDSAGSQWYIVLEDSASATNLDGQYTNFGHVIEGLDVVQQIAQGDVMTKVDTYTRDASESVISPDDIRNGNLPGDG